MHSDKRSCIFEHYGFVYVCDFHSMLMWITHEEDDDPVTSLEIMRHSPKLWQYRTAGTVGGFTPDSDSELIDRLEEAYTQYLNTLIVGNDGRAKDKAKAVTKERVRKAALRYESQALHSRRS